MSERRSRLAEVRAVDAGPTPGVTLHCIRPNVVDDYGSLWASNAFDESLARELPTLCWAHDWGNPLGRGVAFRTSPDGPDVDFVFDDFEAVPTARRAHAQVKSGTLRYCSVGFSNASRRTPTADEERMFPGVLEVIERANLDEVSIVLRGAVPGAVVTGVRQPVRPAAYAARLAHAEGRSLRQPVPAGDLDADMAAALDTLNRRL